MARRDQAGGVPPDQAADTILEALTTGVIAMDRDGRITYINRTAAQISSLGPEEALGQPCRQVLKSSLCDGECPLKRAVESGECQYHHDAVFIRHGGRSVVPVMVSVAPLHDREGRIVGAVETIQSQALTKIMERRSGTEWADFIGESPEVLRNFEVLKVVAPTAANILIEGPTGTGKDLLARIIHHQSPRGSKPFIKVNCAALPENLLESEMFGYQRGAFTGADRDKPGRFHLADGGTIFLDEISEMPLSLQAKLLRVIEEKEFYPLGARKTTKVDVRILAACNQPLAGQVQAGAFREDLFYRLNVIRVHIPALTQRRQDIPLLIRRFIQKKNVERGTFICRFSQGALDRLLNYDYPGNVREMENILEHACLLCRGDVIREDHLPWSLQGETAPPLQPSADERQELLAALTREGWSRTRTAQALGIDRSTLWRRMKRLGISQPD